MMLVLASLLVLDGYLGRSGDVDKPLPPLPPGVTWTMPKEEPRNAYTSYVGQAVACVGRLHETDELVVGTGYPQSQLHLFGKDGKEVFDNGWPRGGWFEHIAFAGGRTWAMGRGVMELTRKRGREPLRIGGREVDSCHGIVVQPAGYWLKCRQGWLYYDAKAPQTPVRRHGALGGVTALALLDGCVYAFRGTIISRMWLDDRADEAFLPNGFDNGLAAGRWTGVVDAAEVVDGKIRYSFTKEGKNYLLDPKVTEWIFRARREAPTDTPVVKKPHEAALPGGLLAVADGKSVFLRDAAGKTLQTLPVPATLLASEGRWLVAYVPSQAAILRFRLR